MDSLARLVSPSKMILSDILMLLIIAVTVFECVPDDFVILLIILWSDSCDLLKRGEL